MKIALLALLFASPAFLQAQSARAAGACGPEKVNFTVKAVESEHVVQQPEPGKALVYFFQDSGMTSVTFGAYPTTKVGMDGAWVGANHNSTFFSVSADPGVHHLCTVVQSKLLQRRLELAHFTAVAGKIYYYRTRLTIGQALEYLELRPVDSDEARYLIATDPRSVSRPKK